MSIGSDTDWRGMRRAGRIVQETLETLERHVRPGVTTAELDRLAAEVVSRAGAQSAPAMVYGFPGTVLISVNDEVVHGVPGPRRLADGDLVKLDVTLEKGGYMADAARTVLVGRGTNRARRLLECARDALAGALTSARAGVRINEVGRAVQQVVEQRGFAVIRALCGHGIGRTIHEPPSVLNYYEPRETAVLTEGLVLTIEPIICAGSGEAYEDRDGWTIRTRDASLAAHFEHTLVITRTAPVLLTGA
jgi:methionyl aminopeptidase